MPQNSRGSDGKDRRSHGKRHVLAPKPSIQISNILLAWSLQLSMSSMMAWANRVVRSEFLQILTLQIVVAIVPAWPDAVVCTPSMYTRG
jgi:hypothetical protein